MKSANQVAAEVCHGVRASLSFNVNLSHATCALTSCQRPPATSYCTLHHRNHDHSRRHWRTAERFRRVSVPSATASDYRTDCNRRLYKSSKHSDCKITCGSYTFDAHKAVICSQSGYFDTALKNGTFKVRHPTSTLTRPPLTSDRRERPELSSLQQCRMAPTALMYATTRRS